MDGYDWLIAPFCLCVVVFVASDPEAMKQLDEVSTFVAFNNATQTGLVFVAAAVSVASNLLAAGWTSQSVVRAIRGDLVSVVRAIEVLDSLVEDTQIME